MTPNLAREIAVELISGTILEAVLLATLLLAPMISDFFKIQIELIQIISLILIFSVALIILRIAIVKKKISAGPQIAIIRNRPNYVAKKGIIGHFGVKWKVEIGSQYRGDLIQSKQYAWVEGPFCPDCLIKLMPKTFGKWLGLSYQHVWLCPQCEKRFARPKQYLFEEDEAIEKIADGYI